MYCIKVSWRLKCTETVRISYCTREGEKYNTSPDANSARENAGDYANSHRVSPISLKRENARIKKAGQ